jgi:Mg2+-importing ATPase
MLDWKKAAQSSVTQVFMVLQTGISGLSSEEGNERRIVQTMTIPFWKWPVFLIMQRRFRSAFFYLLIGAAALSFFLGDRIEAMLILSFVFLNFCLESFQEYRSEKAVQLLAKYLSHEATVMRDGMAVTIESTLLVPGDVILLRPGDRLPADVRFFEEQAIEVDESVLTGETLPVLKTSEALSQEPEGYHEAKNIGFSGTVALSGHGKAVVIAVGDQTAFGSIATLAEMTKSESVFERQLREFTQFVVKLVAVTLIAVFSLNILAKGFGIDIPELLVFSLVLAVSVVPEALPAVTTISLSRGALALAKSKVVVKRLSSIEDLGSINVLCTDKTGTITENRLQVSDVLSLDREECLRYAVLGGRLPHHELLSQTVDPYERALELVADHRVRHEETTILDALPFDPNRRMGSILHAAHRGEREIIVRGAPESILSVTDHLTSEEKEKILLWVDEEGRKGCRTLAIARRSLSARLRYTLATEKKLEYLGVISFSDPLKSTTKKTIAEANRLGISVKILTGDSREVARSVGIAAGILEEGSMVYTEAELRKLSEKERLRAFEEGSVFARMSPEGKYLAVESLKRHFTVGFLGEGVNDAPALKLAHVGIVVRGAADIARDAADVVILQNSLRTVIDGVREGRIIFANILKYLRVTLASNFGNFYSVAIASFFLPFVPLLPAQILLLDLISDFPMLAITTDTIESSELATPRQSRMRDIIISALLFGGVSSIFDLTLFRLYFQSSPAILQTSWFLLSVTTEIILLYSLRSSRWFFLGSRPSAVLVGFSALALGVAFLLPLSAFGVGMFGFIAPHGSMVAIIASLAVGYFLMTEVVKRSFSHLKFFLNTKPVD